MANDTGRATQTRQQLLSTVSTLSEALVDRAAGFVESVRASG